MQADRTYQPTQVENHDIQHHKKHQKNPKKAKYIPVDEQVVFTLINSINMLSVIKNDSNQVKLKTDSNLLEQKTLLQEQLISAQKSGVNKNGIIQLICTKIKAIPYNGVNDLRMKLRSSLRKVYMSKKTLNDFKTQQSLENYALSIINETIKGYLSLSQMLRQCAVPTPVQQGFYDEYSQFWKEIIEKLSNQPLQQQACKSKKQIIKQELLNIWQQIPHLSLSKHLTVFQLKQTYSLIQEETMIKNLSSLLVDNKIQQCCTYYEIYLLGRNNNNLQSLKMSLKLRQFEDLVLIPRITKSDHIFSSHVLTLFKANPQLKQRLLNSKQLQPSIGLRVVDLLKQDGRDYYNIYMHILHQHYKSIIYDHKTWYMVEDKLSFNKNFIQWYTQDMVKVMKGQFTQKDDRMIKISKQLKDVTNIQHLQLSILERNKIIDLQHFRLKNKEFQRIVNPLYENDRFDCAQLVIEEVSPQLQEKHTAKYLRFQQYGVTQKDINFIDSIDEKFHNMCSKLLGFPDQPIGFDTEFRCVSTKYQQQGVSLIQLSTNTDHFVIDFLKLQNDKDFNKFIIQLLCNENYLKIGHTISSDIKYLRMTLKIPEQLSIKNFVDITVMFKLLHPNQKFSSLSFMCQKFLHRKLSKYQQRGNWNRRPLKKTQIHYGALDAFSCVLIYDHIKDDYFHMLKHGKLLKKQAKSVQIQQSKQQFITKKQQQQRIQEKNQDTLTDSESKFVGDTYRSERLIYNKKFQTYLNSKQPKFLVDNMLKKLSSVMRNCGLDAEYIAVRDYELASEIAEKDQRIILTRDMKFFQRKDNRIPIYLIVQKNDSDKMFEQVKQFFKLDLSEFKTLSRCVKCNGSELIIISNQEAMKEIKFRYQDSKVQVFWRCTKCRQIYWEGGQFERAKQKYGNLKN